MFPGASRVLLVCGLLCAAGGGFDGRGIQAESSPAVKTAWEHVVFRSFDGGHTFAASSEGLGSPLMGRAAKVTIDPTDSRVMYVGSEAPGGGAVYKSYDGGPNEPSVLYVTGPEGTYKTTSGGQSR